MMLSSRLPAGAVLGLSLAAVALLPMAAVAQNYDIKSFHGHTPSSDELIESLKPSQPPEGIKFRGVRPVQATKPKAVALSIQFEFGSAQLSSDAKTVLDNLGAALKSPDLSANIFLIEGLKSEQPAGGGLKFRGVRPVEATKPKAVSLMVQFEFGSSELTPDAKQVLNNLGSALKSPQLGADSFLIEGHTDSVGSDEYNQRLSEARAASVKTYLTGSLGVQPSRLETVGKGEAQPLDASNTEAAVNRRVQIVNVR